MFYNISIHYADLKNAPYIELRGSKATFNPLGTVPASLKEPTVGALPPVFMQSSPQHSL